jgi:hypothetical protein
VNKVARKPANNPALKPTENITDQSDEKAS